MTRWHEPECLTPDISLDGVTLLPSCRACDCAPDLERLLGEQKIHSPFPAPPPDEPKGKMDLWWPPSVPWIGESSKGRYTREDETNHDGNDPDTLTNSSIYPGKLCYGEFSLACITSSPGSPITSPFVAINPSLLNEFKFRIPVRVWRSMWVRDKDIIQAKKFRIGVSNETIGSADSNSIFTRLESVHSFFFHRKTEMGESSGAARYKRYGFGG